MTPVHRALRDGTRDEHDRLDALFAGFDLGDRRHYGAFLSAHAAALVPLEDALDAAGVGRLIPDWPQRRRAALVRDDLAALDRPLPDPVAFGPLVGTGATLGAIYVVEGSRLGGRLLARSVGSGLPRAYLDTDQPAGNWPKLLAQIGALLYTPRDLSDAIGGARDVFGAFEAAGRHWLPKVG